MDHKGEGRVVSVRQVCRYLHGTHNSGYLGRKQWDKGIGGQVCGYKAGGGSKMTSSYKGREVWICTEEICAPL